MRCCWIHVVFDSNQSTSGSLFPDMASVLMFAIHNIVKWWAWNDGRNSESSHIRFIWTITMLDDLGIHRVWLSLRKFAKYSASQDWWCVRCVPKNTLWNWKELSHHYFMLTISRYCEYWTPERKPCLERADPTYFGWNQKRRESSNISSRNNDFMRPSSCRDHGLNRSFSDRVFLQGG